MDGPFAGPDGRGGTPVFSGSSAGFDAVHTCDPSVIKVGGTYYMYYTGAAGDHAHGNAIGLATSTDGRVWTRANGGRPLVTAARNVKRDNTYGAGQPSAVYLAGYFYLMFTDTTGQATGHNGAGQFVLRSTGPGVHHGRRGARRQRVPAGARHQRSRTARSSTRSAPTGCGWTRSPRSPSPTRPATAPRSPSGTGVSASSRTSRCCCRARGGKGRGWCAGPTGTPSCRPTTRAARSRSTSCVPPTRGRTGRPACGTSAWTWSTSTPARTRRGRCSRSTGSPCRRRPAPSTWWSAGRSCASTAGRSPRSSRSASSPGGRRSLDKVEVAAHVTPGRPGAAGARPRRRRSCWTTGCGGSRRQTVAAANSSAVRRSRPQTVGRLRTRPRPGRSAPLSVGRPRRRPRPRPRSSAALRSARIQLPAPSPIAAGTSTSSAVNAAPPVSAPPRSATPVWSTKTDLPMTPSTAAPQPATSDAMSQALPGVLDVPPPVDRAPHGGHARPARRA